MKHIILTALLFASFTLFAQEYEYKCDSAKFSIVFDGKPIVKHDGNLTDVLYESEKGTVTYIASYKKQETELEGKDYCNYIKEKYKNDAELDVSYAKTFDFNGKIALKAETIKEKRYISFTYETISFKHNGYEIELIAMSKAEDVDFKDLMRFAKTFKFID